MQSPLEDRRAASLVPSRAEEQLFSCLHANQAHGGQSPRSASLRISWQSKAHQARFVERPLRYLKWSREAAGTGAGRVKHCKCQSTGHTSTDTRPMGAQKRPKAVIAAGGGGGGGGGWRMREDSDQASNAEDLGQLGKLETKLVLQKDSRYAKVDKKVKGDCARKAVRDAHFE